MNGKKTLNQLESPGAVAWQASSYPVYYLEADSQNETEKVKVLFLPETSIRLKNLTSYTKYLVRISAFNAAGDGPKSSSSQGRTHQAAPGAPSFLAFSEITCSTLNVSWGEPAAANGILQGYRVIYEPLSPVQGVSKVVTVDIKGNWQHWLKIRDLTKGITYLFRMQARTITYGPELQANVTAGPAEGKNLPIVRLLKAQEPEENKTIGNSAFGPSDFSSSLIQLPLQQGAAEETGTMQLYLVRKQNLNTVLAFIVQKIKL
ncbi:UNVERIFIED_CONTAM: Protein sidekick-1 [Gekko kuhli]